MTDPRSAERTVVLQDEGLRHLRGFTAIPNFILRHPLLSSGAKLTFAVLLSYAWQDDFCWPAQERLASDLQCSSRHVRRFLCELRDAKIVTWKQRGLTQSNIYTILPQSQWLPYPGSIPDRTELSAQDRPPMSVLEGALVSDKEDTMKKIQSNVYVGQNFFRKAPPERGRVELNGGRRWQLTGEELEKADALAHTIAEEIGQPENLRSYFVCAGEALEAGEADAIFTAIGLTKEERAAGRIRTTPSQYFHHTLLRLLKRGKGRQIDRSPLL